MDYKHLIAPKGSREHPFTHNINYGQERKRRSNRSRRTMRKSTKERIVMLKGTVADQNTKLATLRHKVISQKGLLQAKEFSKVLNKDLAFTFYSESKKIREINTRLIKEVSNRNKDLLYARDHEEKLKKQLGQLRLQLQLSATRTLFFKYLYLTPAQRSTKIDTLYTSNAQAKLCNRPIILNITPGLISKQLNTSSIYLVLT